MTISFPYGQLSSLVAITKEGSYGVSVFCTSDKACDLGLFSSPVVYVGRDKSCAEVFIQDYIAILAKA